MDVGGEIKLAVGSDFIAPALACTKPKQIEAADQSKATPGPTKHVLRIEGSDESMKPTSASVARITLNDCLACSGCVTSAETMLISQQSAEEFLRGSAHATLTLISISPAARAAIAADTGLSVRDAFSRLTSFFKGLGCDRVLDCGLASDLSLLQNAAEFVQRFKLKQPATEERLQPPPVLESVLESASVGPLPLVSSSCPGWVCYAEKTQGAVLAHLSTAKSPQQVAGTLLKRVYGASLNVPPDRIYHATVMPCYDKKLEASRDDFVDDSAGATGARDVDCVLSSSEVIELLKSRDPPLSSMCASGAFSYAAPGASGGCAEYVFRHAAHELFGVQLPPGPLEWKQGRNADVSELSLTVGGEQVLRFCRAYGFRNIQNVVRRLKAGISPYHYIELMACPGGCANGGGQPRPPPIEAQTRRQLVEKLYTSAPDVVQRDPRENPHVDAMLAPGGFFEGGLGGERAQKCLLTQFHDRKADAEMTEGSALTTQW